MTIRRSTGAAISCALLLAIAALLALQLTWRGSASAAQPWPVPSSRPAVELGVTTPGLARNSARRWKPDVLEEVNSFEQDAHAHAEVVMWFADWAHVPHFDPHQAAAVAARGSTPEISWEPWDSTRPLRTPQPGYELGDIIGGAHDPYIERWAREIAAYGRPVLLRFAQEMNGGVYPWAESANGNRAGQFVDAWRHIHLIFDEAGASNVRWVWSPVVGTITSEQYPGASLVDVVGLSGFVADRSVFGVPWRSFPTAFGPSLDTLHSLAPDKPLSLAEVGVAQSGGDKAAWITQMFEEIEVRPYIKSIVWFNVRKEANWPIESSLSAERAFAAGLRLVAQ